MPNKLVKKILYIEDDAGLARLMEKRMERFGLTVDTAGTGEDGIRKFHENTYDVILVDNYLPGISGLDVLKKIHPGEFDTPLIFITSSGDERLAIEALKSGAADYMIKDPGQTYFDLLPSVMNAAFTRIRLANQNKAQEETLRNYAAELMRSEDRLNLALEGSEIGVWDWDLVTGELFWTDNLKSMLELPKDQKPTTDYFISRIHPDDREMVIESVRKYLSHEAPEYTVLFREKNAHRADHEWSWMLDRGIAKFDENNKPLRMVGTTTDFTTHKELGEQYEAAKNKAESANLAKTEFLATMSHEIRTPMNAIIGLSDILSRSPLNESQSEIVKTLQSSSSTLLSLINDLLDISRIEANQVDLDEQPVKLAELITETTNMFVLSAKQKYLNFEVDVANLNDRIFLCDHLRIRQIINNLCSNALKFTDKGSVKLSASYKSDKSDLCEVTIKVSDSGIGIPAEKLEVIFQKFMQADQSITRRFGGTGLGLAISKSLALKMGGDLQVESVENEGSTFIFTAPFKCTNHRAVKQPIIETLINKTINDNPHVLLVEDYPANVMVACFMLDDMGYTYDVATNGIEAIEKMTDDLTKFDVILMDIQMQGMDGFQATKQIRTLENDQPLLRKHIIIGLTAHALAGDRERCLASGMNEYVTKPINAYELKNKITSLWARDHK